MCASYKAQNMRYGAKDEIQTNTKHKLDSKRRYQEQTQLEKKGIDYGEGTRKKTEETRYNEAQDTRHKTQDTRQQDTRHEARGTRHKS